MAKMLIEDSPATRIKPEYAERQVQLSPAEKSILHDALLICEKASELQAAINRLESVPDEYNDFEWARIYLADIMS